MTVLVPFPDDFDPYGKDLTPATTGRDNVYRLTLDREGYAAGPVILLSEEDTEAYRKRTKEPPKKRRKAK